jgi:type IV fimbrial biogenesis protein FimT
MTPMRTEGFTLIEAAVVVAIVGIVAAVGMPGMSNWLLARRAQSAAGYYADGFALARNLAIEHNGATRLVLNENATSGQMEWQVDLCFPTPDLPCDDQNGAWSTPTTAVSDPQIAGSSVKSVTRSGAGLPLQNAMNETTAPDGATAAYFTPMGWLDAAVSPQLKRIVLAPSYQRAGAFAPMAVALTLAGVVSRCNPAVTGQDPRRCPP